MYVPSGGPANAIDPQFTAVDPTGAGPDYDILYTLTQELSTLFTCNAVDNDNVLWNVVGLGKSYPSFL